MKRVSLTAGLTPLIFGVLGLLSIESSYSEQSDAAVPNGVVSWVGTVCPNPAQHCVPGPTVTVAVKAHPGQSGDALHYRWLSTDGSILDQDAPTTIWKMAPGHGLHFVYVLVSNKKGGYAERRAVVNTDHIGSAPPDLGTANRYVAPPAPAVTTGAYQSYSDVPDVPFALKSANPTVPYQSRTVTSDSRGRFAIYGIPQDSWQSLTRIVAGSPQALTYFNMNAPFGGAGGVYYPDQQAVSASFDTEGVYNTTPKGGFLYGYSSLADGSPCGMVNEFFGIDVTSTAKAVVDGHSTSVKRASAGEYSGEVNLPNPNPNPSPSDVAQVYLHCEGSVVSLPSIPFYGSGAPFELNFFNTVFKDSIPPTISNITVTLSGKVVGSLTPNDSCQTPIDLCFKNASASLPRRDAFFTMLGVDTRLGACRYYEAIGVGKCDTKTMTLVDAIDFVDWKRATGMAPYTHSGQAEITASFVNRMDLNLARNHHAISYGPDQTAAYVCNGLGPTFVASNGDSSVKTAIANAVAGRNRIACVAMDYTRTPGVNGNQPFVRFIIFGPDGRVLPSINLDGRAEKFVPGVCIACHGGSNYAGQFPKDGSGRPDLGAHFLPYDTGNFLFSPVMGYREADQEAAIKALNMIVLRGTGATDGEVNLINGWYAPGLKATFLNKNYIPADWDGLESDLQGPIHRTYHEILAPMCRTCHSAMAERFNLDDYFSLLDAASRGDSQYPVDPQLLHEHSVCEPFSQPMPNSLVTFNRFWTTKGTANDLVQLWTEFLGLFGHTCSGAP